MKILAVDLGRSRTGIAVSDIGESFAFPRDCIKEKDTEALVEKICEVAVNERVKQIVVGLPKNMDGSLGEKAQECTEIADKIKSASGLPVDMYDERCTTVIAHNMLRGNGLKEKKHKDIVDSAAAVLILESYMQSRK